MRAMMLDKASEIAARPLVLRESPAPKPGRGEVLIDVTACGICRTDLHIVEGELPLPKLPLVPGHQVVGRVSVCGRGAARFAPGMRVGVPWLYRTCGLCEFCSSGRENLCESAEFTGYHANGGYAEQVVAPEDYVCEIPENFSDADAAPLLCAGVIGYRALGRSGIQPGGRLALYGFGGSAHIALQVARHWGCETYVFTRSEEHRRLALELGASWTGLAEEDPPHRAHAAVIFAPAGPLVPEALRILCKGGAVALAGIYMSPIPEMEYGPLYHEREIRSVANCTRRDAAELLELAGRIPIRTEVETFPLEEANEALLRLKQSRIRGAAALEIR